MELNDADFTKLVTWLGPKALRTLRKYPDGQRYFNTETRVFRFNIDPHDYFQITPGEVGVREPKIERTIPEAYRAMRDVIEALRARKIHYQIVRVSWAAGGSYIEAILPRPN